MAIAARICPNDVRLTREGLPEADQMQPGQFFSMCWGRWAAVPRKTEKRTVLFAPAKFVNDLEGRFCN